MAISENASASDNHPVADPEELGRAEMYRLLSLLLIAPPPPYLLDALREVPASDSPLGKHLQALARASKDKHEQAIAQEFDVLFLGVPRGELMPYGSYYRDGRLFSRPLAELRMDLAQLGVARRENATEPEDHLGTLMEIMACLILGAFGKEPLPLAEQRRFFLSHVEPWASKFFDDLAKAKAACFYAAVAGLGNAFIDLEREAFRMVAD